MVIQTVRTNQTNKKYSDVAPEYRAVTEANKTATLLDLLQLQENIWAQSGLLFGSDNLLLNNNNN